MKHKSLLPLAASSAILVSCASQEVGDENYDVSNPYAAPDYKEENATSYEASDVNPAYEAPAAYEETSPLADSTQYPAPAYSPASRAAEHTVVSGDSLWKIAKSYGVTVEGIKQANGLTNDIAVLGATLKIPAP